MTLYLYEDTHSWIVLKVSIEDMSAIMVKNRNLATANMWRPCNEATSISSGR